MKILFDETQKERGKIFENFQKLANILEEEGHEISKHDSYPIKYSNISKFDIFVFLCPDGSKIMGHEVKALLRFVDEGGALAVFTNAGGDKGLNTNLNTLLKHFNVEIVANQIFDYQNFDLELESNIIVSKFYKHPITEGLSEITMVSSCSLHLKEGVEELARTKKTSDPPSSAVMCISSYGLGTVFVCGSYLLLSDSKSGIKLRDNSKLAKNLFTYVSVPPAFTKQDEELAEEAEEDIAETVQKIDVKEKAREEPFESVSKIDMVKKALSKGETDTVKAEVIKAMKSLKEEIRATKTVEREPEIKAPHKNVYESISIIQELEKDIDELKIEDPGYRDILLTDMARRKGIDYAQILPYLERIREKEERDKSKKEKRKKAAKSAIRGDITSIPEPRTPEMDKFEKDIMIFDQELQVDTEVQKVQPAEQMQKIDDLTQAVRELKNSLDVLSANLIHLISEIVLEMKEQKGKKR